MKYVVFERNETRGGVRLLVNLVDVRRWVETSDDRTTIICQDGAEYSVFLSIESILSRVVDLEDSPEIEIAKTSIRFFEAAKLLERPVVRCRYCQRVVLSMGNLETLCSDCEENGSGSD